MSEIVEQAVKNRATMNCAQSVACAFAGHTQFSPEQLATITTALGTGCGNMQATCGAILGAGVIIGCKWPDRMESRRHMSAIMNEFKRLHSTTKCCQLKGLEEGFTLVPCPECVATAASLLEKEISNTIQ